jgi:hypothetical protein
MTALVLPGVVAAAVSVNVPFGAWRATLPRLSWRWFLAIHLPIPLVFLIRYSSGLSWHWIPVMLGCAVAGQLIGSWLYVHYRLGSVGTTDLRRIADAGPLETRSDT